MAFLAAPPEGFLQATEAVTRLPPNELELLVRACRGRRRCFCVPPLLKPIPRAHSLTKQCDVPGATSVQVSAAAQRQPLARGYCNQGLAVSRYAQAPPRMSANACHQHLRWMRARAPAPPCAQAGRRRGPAQSVRDVQRTDWPCDSCARPALRALAPGAQMAAKPGT
jgi:hypothetical protein